MKRCVFACMACFLMGMVYPAFGAYHHMDEQDGPKFQQAYPHLIGTKVDDCALCHSGGTYEKKPGKFASLGSCQWCHMTYGYDGSGDIEETINSYGADYRSAGRDVSAFAAIEGSDSDGDGYTNKEELGAVRFPGNADDDPTKVPAPRIVYTLEDLEQFEVHKQFLLMNTSRGGTTGKDYYAEYEGVTVEELLEEAGMRSKAESITVFCPDGWSQSFDLEPGGQAYYINGEYPQASYYYDAEADAANGGWVDYSAPACQGRENGQAITNDNGLRCMLAYKLNGVYLEKGVIDEQNKLKGEGPYRVVPPQKLPGPPDQIATSTDQNVVWPYDGNEIGTDHNAGSAPRTSTAIRVEPLPEGTTDFNWYEGGWSYVDNQQLIIYGYLRNGTIEGVVTDAAGNPVEKARVYTERGGYSAITDADGNYSIAGVVCGSDTATYTLRVTAAGYQAQSTSVEVFNKETVIADFTLNAGSDNGTCPVETASGRNQSLISLCRVFRDTVLAQSTAGARYTQMYYRAAPEITLRMLGSGVLRQKVVDTLESFHYAVAAMVAGERAEVTASQVAQIRELMDLLKDGASPALAHILRNVDSDITSGALETTIPVTIAK